MVMVAQQYERAGCPRTIYANTLGTDISSHIRLTTFKNRQVQKETGVHTDVHVSLHNVFSHGPLHRENA